MKYKRNETKKKKQTKLTSLLMWVIESKNKNKNKTRKLPTQCYFTFSFHSKGLEDRQN